MLNLTVAMRCLFLSLLFALALVRTAAAQEPIVITAPLPGQAVQGVLTVTGTSQVDDFQSAELSFAYEKDPTGTWFVIQQSGTPVLSGTLGTWDTSAITDGTYRLRLRVRLSDGRLVDTVVDGLRVRNYTPVETSTPDAALEPTLPPLPASTPTEPPTPTALPPNPAGVTPESAWQAMGRGALVILGSFVFFGLLIRLRRR